MSEKLVKMFKEGTILEVHPTCVAAHVLAGWKRLDEVKIETTMSPEAAAAEKAVSARGKATVASKIVVKK